jgi:hypothetical protein
MWETGNKGPPKLAACLLIPPGQIVAPPRRDRPLARAVGRAVLAHRRAGRAAHPRLDRAPASRNRSRATGRRVALAAAARPVPARPGGTKRTSSRTVDGPVGVPMGAHPVALRRALEATIPPGAGPRPAPAHLLGVVPAQEDDRRPVAVPVPPIGRARPARRAVIARTRQIARLVRTVQVVHRARVGERARAGRPTAETGMAHGPRDRRPPAPRLLARPVHVPGRVRPVATRVGVTKRGPTVLPAPTGVDRVAGGPPPARRVGRVTRTTGPTTMIRCPSRQRSGAMWPVGAPAR